MLNVLLLAMTVTLHLARGAPAASVSSRPEGRPAAPSRSDPVLDAVRPAGTDSRAGGERHEAGPEPGPPGYRTRREVLDSLRHLRRLRHASVSSSPSLSIINPLDVLRRRVMLEMLRRRIRKNRLQISKNSDILARKGKRSTRTQLASNNNLSEGPRRFESSQRQSELS
ncbi:uncharacterized protein LOC119103400 [Pollicipes pollicipes]|uniref:uncharacterized protein LOC119103400 n=1 Tax=Pollicipes pollicipes TaxID=41117 RepID=UPI0018852D9E|nr:uncharacterized protein LOC119103400 [Pollicipes pollicipes]